MSDAAPREPADEREVAALVREASRYVAASPQLRPRVVEAAREATAQRRRFHRLIGTVTVVLTLTCSSAAVDQRWQWLAPPQGVTSEQLHRLAGHRAVTAGVGFDWALADVVADWRSGMASATGSRGAPVQAPAAVRAPAEDGQTP